jgi:hypothetical protein
MITTLAEIKDKSVQSWSVPLYGEFFYLHNDEAACLCNHEQYTLLSATSHLGVRRLATFVMDREDAIEAAAKMVRHDLIKRGISFR